MKQPLSGIGIVLRLNNEDMQRILRDLKDGSCIGDTVELRITDNFNRFDLGTFTARIEKWNPARKATE